MGTVESTTTSAQLRYPGSRRIERQTSTGHLFYISWGGSATVQIFRSTNNGTTWTAFGASRVLASPVTEFGSMSIDWQNRLYFTWRSSVSGQQRIYMQAAVITATGPSWHSPLLVNSASDLTGSAPMVVRHHDGRTTGVVAVTWSNASNVGVTLNGFTIPAVGQPVLNNNVVSNKRSWNAPGSALGHTVPAVGYELSPAHIWVTFGRTYLHAVKCTWNGAGWTGPNNPVRITPGTIGVSPAPVAMESCASIWRNPGWVTAQPTPEDATTILLSERNQANSFTTYKVSQTHPTGNIRSCALAQNTYSKDVRIYAVGTSTDVLYYCDYIASSGTFTSWASVVATAITGADNYSVRRDNNQSTNFDVFTQSGTVTPWTITHTAQKATYAPFVPTWNEGAMGRASGSAADVGAGLPLQWVFTDPDPGDAQSAWALKRTIGAGTAQYLRASDSTWQATEQKNTGGAFSRTLAAGWGVDGDAAHTYQVKVWDSTDTGSAYSVGHAVLPSAKSDPQIVIAEIKDINPGLDTGFEVGTAGFVGINGTLTQSATFAHGGTKSAKFVTAASSDPKITRNGNDPVVGGQVYTFEVWAYAPVILGATNSVTIEWWNGTSFVSSVSNFVSLSAGTWTKLSVTATAPIGVTGCRRSVGLVGAVAAGLEYYIDDARVLSPWSGTIHTDTAVVSWAVAEMTAFRITLSTNPGNVVVYDSGWKGSATDTSFEIPYRVPDGTTWTVGLQTRNNEGLPSNVVTAGFFVDYAEPPSPSVTLTPLPNQGIIRAVIDNPPSVGAQPVLLDQTLYRRPRLYANLLPDPGVEGLSAVTLEDFEDATFVNTWTFSGPGGVWGRDSSRAYAGSWSYRSPSAITHTQKSDMDIVIPAGATAIRVRYWVSSEAGFDWFRITNFVTDAVLFQDSGLANDWRTAQVNLPSGATKITLRYVKDGADSKGDDGVWIDNLEFLGPDAGFIGNPGDATALRTQTVKHSGDWSIQITPNGTGLFPRNDSFLVALTGTMRGGGWIRASAGTSPLQVVIHAFNAAGGYLTTRGIRTVTAAIDQWVYVETTAEFGDVTDAALCAVAIGRGDGITAPPAGDIFYVDDFWLSRDDPTPGAVVASGRLSAAASQDLVVIDSFSRTVSSGWGTPDTGTPWTTSGGVPTDFAVAAGAGTFSLGAVNAARRAVTTAEGDIDTTAIIVVPVTPTGGPIVAGILTRFTDADNFYLGEIVINTNSTVLARVRKNVATVFTSIGSSSAIAGLSHTAGKRYRMRFVNEGASLRVRIWDEAFPEPSVWHLDLVDSSLNPLTSSAGFRAALDSANTNTLPVVVSFDSFLVNGLSGGGSTAAIVDDWHAAANVDHEYRVLARGTNGTSAVSPWTA